MNAKAEIHEAEIHEALSRLLARHVAARCANPRRPTVIDFDYLARKALIHVYNTKPCSGSREEEDRHVASLAAVLRDAATHKVALNAQEAADEMGRASAMFRALLCRTFNEPVHEFFSSPEYLRWSAAVNAYEPFVGRPQP